MAKKKLTQNDLDKTLRDFGFKEGDELDLPDDVSSEKSQSNEQSETNEGEGDDTGGSNPPGNKPKPDKP